MIENCWKFLAIAQKGKADMPRGPQAQHVHKTPRTSPAMAAGVSEAGWEMEDEDIARLINNAPAARNVAASNWDTAGCRLA